MANNALCVNKFPSIQNHRLSCRVGRFILFDYLAFDKGQSFTSAHDLDIVNTSWLRIGINGKHQWMVLHDTSDHTITLKAWCSKVSDGLPNMALKGSIVQS